MKTKLPERITTVEQAKEFLTELHSNHEHYNPEDNAHEIGWRTLEPPTDYECLRLNRLMQEIYGLPGNENAQNMVFDPCGFLLELDGHVIEQEPPKKDSRYPNLDFMPEGALEPWDGIEVGGCVDEDGVVSGGVDDNEAEFWSVYLRNTTGGVDYIADLPTRELADKLAAVIQRAAESFIKG